MRPPTLFIGWMMVFASLSFAGEKDLVQSSHPEPPGQAPWWSIDVNTDYTLGSKIRKSGDFGSQAVYHYEIEALRNVYLFDHYYLQFGVDSERYDFSRSNSLYPSSIASLAGEISFPYWNGDDFHSFLKFEP